MFWPFFTVAPVPWMRVASRSLPSGLGALLKSREVTAPFFSTTFGAHDGAGWDLPDEAKILSAGAVMAPRDPIVLPLRASMMAGLPLLSIGTCSGERSKPLEACCLV